MNSACDHGAVIETGEPGEFCDDTFCHGVADVGENAGADACALQPCCPFDHGRI